MRRRDFIKVLAGSAIAWPLAVRAQQTSIPVIGYLDSRSPEGMADRLRGFRQGLKEIGYVEGENVAIVYRWAEDRIDRLQTLAADLVRRPVAVIATAGPPSSFAAKAATTTIPIVFLVGNDPVRLGLTTSLSHPAGNMTGINVFNSELAAKAAGAASRSATPGCANCCACQSSRRNSHRNSIEGSERWCSCHGSTSPGPQRRHQRRDRCRLRSDRSRATRCGLCRDNSVFEWPAGPAGSTGGVSPTSSYIRVA